MQKYLSSIVTNIKMNERSRQKLIIQGTCLVKNEKHFVYFKLHEK